MTDPALKVRKIGTTTSMFFEVTGADPIWYTQNPDTRDVVMTSVHVRVEFHSGRFHEMTILGRVVGARGRLEGGASQRYRETESDEDEHSIRKAPRWARELLTEAKFAMVVDPDFGTVVD